MADSTAPTIDPTKEYDDETLAAMQQVVAAAAARKQAAISERNQRYKVKVDAVVATPEYAKVRAALASLAADEDRDDNFRFYVDAARLNLSRLAGE